MVDSENDLYAVKDSGIANTFNAPESGEILDVELREGTKRLLEYFREERKADPADKEQTTQILIDCLKDAMVVDLQVFFDSGIDPLHRDPATGLTLLHLAAGYGDNELLQHLHSCPDTDYTMKDGRGRLASTMAFAHGGDAAMARPLVKKQGDQARERGVVLHGPQKGATTTPQP